MVEWLYDRDGAKKREIPKENAGFPGDCVAIDQWAIKDSNLRLPPCKGGGSAKQLQAGKELATTPFVTSPSASPCGRKNGNANGTPDAGTATARDTGEERSEGDDGAPVDQLAKLAAAVAALAPADRERLAALLRGTP
jgi:hypothetical protein